jgi:hypothetical protein
MSQQGRAPHPKYPDVTQKEWALAEHRVFVMIASRIGNALGDPSDLAKKAVARAYEPTAPEWDRTKKTLAQYLGSFANSMMANGFRRHEYKTTSQLSEAHLETAKSAADTPEEAFAEAEAEANLTRRMTKVREVLKDEPCCVLLLDAVLRREPKPYQAAIEAGFTYRDVELAREKMERAAARIVLAEARAAARKR